MFLRRGKSLAGELAGVGQRREPDRGEQRQGSADIVIGLAGNKLDMEKSRAVPYSNTLNTVATKVELPIGCQH